MSPVKARPQPPAAPALPEAPAAIVTMVDEPLATSGAGSDPYSEENIARMMAMAPPPMRKGGGEDRRPLLAASSASARARNPFGAAPAGGNGAAPAPAGSGAKAVALLAAAAQAGAPAAADPDAAPAPGEAYVAHRQILMAKKGQRPQHWVPWEAVCENTRTHKINVIFEVKLVMRK